ncbi:parallel beta-helix domain-containing protein [Sphingomonas sp.]|uniref:parallel beta-helix domain-containing protein n=1 Tax=Sphingomonas sp. TaxID=28214 RepID=UPI003CC55114
MKAALAFGLMMLAVPAGARTIAVAAGPNAQERLQQALLDAHPGDTVAIAAGRFELNDGLSLDVARVTVRGAGQGRTILSFAHQQGAGEGLLVTSDDVTLRDFAVEDARGDAIKSKAANRIVYRALTVRWTGGPRATNGAYGVYPVDSHDVLIDGVTVEGASDAGIYVGQCENIVVRNSTARGNVAGIEIENSRHADVHDNLATHNTGGILVFDLPNLPRGNGGDVRVFANRVIDNDQANFAPAGNIVAQVRRGTGVLVMANDGVWVRGNTLGGNATANVMIISYRNAFTDARYNPLPRRVQISGNTHGRAGFAPQLPGGDQLVAAFGGAIPPVLWDGAGANLGLRVADAQVLSLGLAPGAAIETAHPAPATLDAPALPERAAVVLPASMAAAAR